MNNLHMKGFLTLIIKLALYGIYEHIYVIYSTGDCIKNILGPTILLSCTFMQFKVNDNLVN